MNRGEKTADLRMNGSLNCAQAMIPAFGELIEEHLGNWQRHGPRKSFTACNGDLREDN
jgi:hypothetical protein